MNAYLDHASIGLVREAPRAAMHAALDEVLAHGSGRYTRFFEARGQARTAAATLLDCDPDEVALVANTSTGLHLVADGLDWHPGDEVVVFDGDFPANVQPWRRLVEHGVRLRWVPMRDGGYDLADIAALVGPATRLIAVSHVHFRTGCRVDLDAVCTLAAPHGALVCVDAVQGLGVVPLAMSRTPVDFLAAGGHKWLGGPPGTGVFFCRASRLPLLRRAPLGWFGYDGSDRIFGQGAGQLAYDLPPRPAARRFEGAMLNFVGIIGLAAALEEINATGVDAIWARVRHLTATLRAGLSDLGYPLATPGTDGHGSGIVSFRPCTDGIDAANGNKLHEFLLTNGCQCSYPDGYIRFSPHYWSTDADVQHVLKLLRQRVSAPGHELTC